MEDAPVTVATGALGPVVAKLSTLLWRRRCDHEYQLRRQTRKEMRLIRSKLKSIHSILWVVWERHDRDTASKELRMEAWRLADDMNDAIDDFIITMKRSNDGKRFMEAKNQPSPFRDLKQMAVDVHERCRNKWKMETAHTTISTLFSRTKATVDSGPAIRPTRVVDPYVHKDISELMEMERPRDTLIQHLVGEEESTPPLKIASILGAAGMGKTTLARLVYEEIGKEFQARAFVSITSSYNMTEVLASILQQVTSDSTDALLAGIKAATKNRHLIKIISNFLNNKRYLVILDDIWHYGEWKTIKMSLPDNNLGSRIVTTSRVIAVTEKWRDDFDAFVYKINYPGDIEFHIIRALKPDMVREGHGIVNMCGGMPLAVACMISALAKERERQEQQGLCVVRTRDVQDRLEEQVMRNGIQNTEGFESLVDSLELGYNRLPHQMLKTCLLYCSIYPEGHCFNRDDLIRRWIAEGFVCKVDAAEDYFDELVSSGLCQEIGASTETVYKVHPMMRNYLRQKLREDNFITCTSDCDISSSRIGRLCIDYWPSSDAVVDPLSGVDWHHIRSLVVFKDVEKVPYKDLEHLRLLDVQPNSGALENQLVKAMCVLLRLRHLFGLHGEGITEIPTGIARLQYLETLEVTGTKITRLPAEIGELKQLKTLDLSQNRGITELPREIENLQHLLERLRIHGSDIREQAWQIIGALKKLKTLDVSWNPELSGIPRDIGELQQLKKLDVSHNRGVTDLPKEIGKLQHLKTLSLAGTGIKELPNEIGNLQQLEALYLRFIPITKLPRGIGKLQHLEILDLTFTDVRKMPREIGGLKKLKNLKARIGTLPFEAGQLSKLERLPKCVHKAWKNKDLMSSLAGEILSFETRDRIGDGGLIIGTKHMHIPEWIKEQFNSIASLEIRICKLEEQDLKILQEMPYLGSLNLRFEVVPRKPIAISGGGFARLWHLTVDSRVPRVIFQEGAMPMLFRLTFEFQFYGGPPNTDHSMGIKHLVSLETISFRCNEWYRGSSPCISAMIDVVRIEARKHPNRIRFKVSGVAEEIFPENSIITENSQDRDVACSSSNGAEEIQT